MHKQCIYNTVILALNSCNYEIRNLWNLGCMKFSGKNSDRNEIENLEYS